MMKAADQGANRGLRVLEWTGSLVPQGVLVKGRLGCFFRCMVGVLEQVQAGVAVLVHWWCRYMLR